MIINSPGKTIYCPYCGKAEYINWKAEVIKITRFRKKLKVKCRCMCCGHSFIKTYWIWLYIKHWFRKLV